MVTGTNSSLQTQLTFTACSFPMTSTSGTSWYQGDKLRATYTAKLTGSRTRRVAPMFSPSFITALNETKDNNKLNRNCADLCIRNETTQMITSTDVNAGPRDNKTVLLAYHLLISLSFKNVFSKIQSKSECKWVDNHHKQVPNIVNRK